MRRVLKWLGVGLGGVILVGIVAGSGMAMLGRSKLNRSYPLPPPAALRTEGPDLVERGRHVAVIHGCTGCHAENLGGAPFLDIPPGRFVAANLTSGRGGIAPEYPRDEDWDRAVRHGLRPDGRPLLPFMPSATFSRIGDTDMAALIAFLKQLPPVDNQLPPRHLRIPGYLMAATLDLGRSPPPPPADRVTEPEPTAAYGEYLASHTCVECHGADLLGGSHPAGIPAPNLAGAGRWPLEQFSRAVREGVGPGERRLSEWMPSKHFAELTDVEVQALHEYLGTLPLGRS